MVHMTERDPTGVPAVHKKMVADASTKISALLRGLVLANVTTSALRFRIPIHFMNGGHKGPQRGPRA